MAAEGNTGGPAHVGSFGPNALNVIVPPAPAGDPDRWATSRIGVPSGNRAVPAAAMPDVISLSPVVRRGVSGVTPTPLFAQFVGVAAGSQVFWFSSKSMFVVPEGFWTRDQNSSRYFAVAVVSL